MVRHGIAASTLALALALSITGCAGQADTATTDTDATSVETTQEAPEADTTGDEVIEDGQNPVMNYVGTYGSGRATITVMPKDAEDADITIHWGSSAFSGSEWTMSGWLDFDTKTVHYTNGTRVDYEYQDEETRTDTVVYTDGTGTFQFETPDPDSLVWQDDMENVAADMVFTFSPPTE